MTGSKIYMEIYTLVLIYIVKLLFIIVKTFFEGTNKAGEGTLYLRLTKATFLNVTQEKNRIMESI